MSRVCRSIPTQSPTEIVRRIPGIIDRHRAEARLLAGAEIANVRSVSIQAIDRGGQNWQSRWRMRVWIAATEDGDPGSGYTVAFTDGAVLQTIIIGGMWEVLSDETGLVGLDLTVVGAATPWVYAEVIGEAKGQGVAFA